STLASINPAGLLALDFRAAEAAARQAAEFAARFPLDAVLGVDDDSTLAAAAIARALGLPHNSIEATVAARHKATMRERLARAAVPQPGFRLCHFEDDPKVVALEVSFPCVVKPTFLAASRGVIRANDPEEFHRAWRRREAILPEPDLG